jgi:hypothetical protein
MPSGHRHGMAVPMTPHPHPMLPPGHPGILNPPSLFNRPLQMFLWGITSNADGSATWRFVHYNHDGTATLWCLRMVYYQDLGMLPAPQFMQQQPQQTQQPLFFQNIHRRWH